MNINSTIIKGIAELLNTNDYVVIPNFGGFVAQVHLSKFLIEKNLLIPPGKVISFNKQLKQNDGLLANWLQAKMEISFDEANIHLKEFSAYCNQVLQIKKRLSLESIGFFYLDFENNLCFESQTSENYYPASFGLSSFSPVELDLEEPTPEITEKTDRRILSQDIEVKTKKYRYIKPIAYAALGGSVLFFTLAALISLHKIEGPLLSGVNTKVYKSTYKPLNYSDIQLQQVSDNTESLLANAEGIAYLNINNTAIAVNSSNEIETSLTKKSRKHKGNFQIVLGCFSMKGNAFRMIKSLKKSKINAEINGVNQKGLHVVSCTGFDTKEEALNYLDQIKASQPNAWVKTNN